MTAPSTSEWLDRNFDWRPMSEYDGESVAMLRSGDQSFMGCRIDGVWTELLDGEIPHPGFTPTHFATVTEEYQRDYFFL